METVNDFVSELGWGTSRESGVAVDPVARDAGDIRGVSEVEDSAGDEMGDRVNPDAFNTWTGRDGVMSRNRNKWADPACQE